jgi:protein-S-isoprenylcysteine O-methyltransferase Ste14
MRFLEHKIPAPVLALLVGVAMGTLAHRTPLADLRSAVAIVTANASAVLALAAFFAFRRAHTTIDPTRPHRASTLVTGGVYRWTRNPMYLSLALVLVAYAIRLGAWVALAGPVLFAAYVTRFQIVPEERALASKFGAAFDEYRRRVRRWL